MFAGEESRMSVTTVMPASVDRASHRLRRSPARKLSLRLVRPSMLDLRFSGDPWVEDRGEESFSLCLGDYRLVSIKGLALDLPIFNRLLDDARHRRPRWRL